MPKIFKFFDKLEDKIRKRLSRYPILYALIGSIGIILLWRGIWVTADEIPYLSSGPISIIVGILILLAIGLFVSFFVGDKIIISGIKEEKRIDEKTEEEIRKETVTLSHIEGELEGIKEDLDEISKK